MYCILVQADPIREEATGDWNTLHSGELRNLVGAPAVMRVTYSENMSWE
jgi:hypothetical protein